MTLPDSKTPGPRRPLEASSAATLASFLSMSSRSSSAAAKVSKLSILVLSAMLTKASETWGTRWMQRTRRSSRAQAGAKWCMPSTNSITESAPSCRMSISSNKVRVSASVIWSGRRISTNRPRETFCVESISPVRLSAKWLRKHSWILRKHPRIFSLKSSRNNDGSAKPRALTNSDRVISPSPSTSMERKAFLASSAVIPSLRTALSKNSLTSSVPPLSESTSQYAFSRLPYCFSSLMRKSSRRRRGDTVEIAAINSSSETFPERSLQTAAKSAWCSLMSLTLTRLSAMENSSKVILELRVRAGGVSMVRTACVIELYPDASHRRRRSSMERTGAAASTAMWKSPRVTWPLPWKSSSSKIMSFSLLGHSKPCLRRMRRHSFFVIPRSMGQSSAKHSQASLIDAYLSRSLWRNSRTVLIVPMYDQRW
mmetsp:Transcript_4638/g.11271  ORF Transcript_4638/g.11271 Transcript_4638/m.11271 type:complete len:426 (-) Transcript_4638:75-1352(-)